MPYWYSLLVQLMGLSGYKSLSSLSLMGSWQFSPSSSGWRSTGRIVHQNNYIRGYPGKMAAPEPSKKVRDSYPMKFGKRFHRDIRAVKSWLLSNVIAHSPKRYNEKKLQAYILGLDTISPPPHQVPRTTPYTVSYLAREFSRYVCTRCTPVFRCIQGLSDSPTWTRESGCNWRFDRARDFARSGPK